MYRLRKSVMILASSIDICHNETFISNNFRKMLFLRFHFQDLIKPTSDENDPTALWFLVSHAFGNRRLDNTRFALK